MTGKNCPNWGNAHFYDDCDLCPTFNECMEETLRRTQEANNMSVEEKLNKIFHYGVHKCDDCTIREGWYPTKQFCRICLEKLKPSRASDKLRKDE